MLRSMISPVIRRPRLALVFGLLAVLTLILWPTSGSVALAAGSDGLHRPILNPPEANSLPIGMTPEEKLHWGELGRDQRVTPPPAGPNIRQCAEWEPVTGALVRYPFGLSNSVLKEVAENIELWVLVANQSEQNTCTTSLTNAGVNMAHVHFIQVLTNSIWTRDYGPQFAFDQNGDQGIIDHVYNRPQRPQDDQVNYTLGPVWGLPVYGTPLIHTGGNYMCDGHNQGFSTDLVWDENPNLSHAQISAYMQSYLGITTYHVIPDIDPGGIHHIDCWAKLLDEQTILVKQVASNHPDYAQLEANVATIASWTNAYGGPYKIVRIYCGSIGGYDVAAYTNSVLLNNKVLVPIFNISTDAAALQTYQDAMPGYEVIPFTGSWVTDDAIHCRCMGIHDKYMLRVDVAPLPDTVHTVSDVRLSALIDDRSETGLKSDSLRVFWRVAGQPLFQSVPMVAAAGPDSFYANIPGQPSGTRVQYYVFGADLSNRRSTRPISAPAGYYSYFVFGDNSGAPSLTRDGDLALSANWPNPFADRTVLNFRLPQRGAVTLSVIDVQGREVATLVHGTLPAGAHSAEWNGRGASGAEAANGLYFFRLTAGAREAVQRGVLIRR